MFDDFSICPYPGLRSFTEEESLFFKGRDSHIEEITELLQENKFLMVTGASGDGKSSIIFAGLIPNARAGFFKAKYTNWQVAHFRPERSPVKNFSEVVGPLLGDYSPDTVQTELMRGYGSLCELYKNSDLYIDESSQSWNKADDEEKKNKKRTAANLLVVVDQFEEFFTNNENFNKGIPSQECQVLVNLLLETTRIAIKEKLPIYVVFTMRSDFIGQCAAFRGLPEFIGYSQFFVPRLNRQQLQHVIEEPAILNGNTISRRLVERLLYDLSEGIDQLPILQHTLNQVWHKANDGEYELDLIHYAKVGGMPEEDLPDDDQKAFRAWFEQLPDYQQEHLADPGLNRVLDNHANELFESAWEYYRSGENNNQLSVREVKLIIALTFASLTKIDDSRAVRNIMSLQEITNIINVPHIDYRTVGKVLNIFREQGNTFIRPFIQDEDESSRELSAESALDITHESLIRNWERLKIWAEKEFEYYETYIDFKKQLDKWRASNYSRGYLLPIGPLTYFETWYSECRPNQYWIYRYERVIDKKNSSIEKSQEILNQTRTFLKKSAKKVAITRAYMKHGSTKAAALLAIIFVMVLSGFYYYDANRKQNRQVLNFIEKSGSRILNMPQSGAYPNALYLITQEMNSEGAFFDGLSSIDSLGRQIEIANCAYEILMSMDLHFEHPVKGQLRQFIDQKLAQNGIKAKDQLEEANHFLYNLGIDNYYNRSDQLEKEIGVQVQSVYPLIEILVKSDKIEDMINFNQGIENVINKSRDPTSDVDAIIALLSPFDETSKNTFEKVFPRNAGVPNGRVGGITHNGGYQLMAYLFAVKGDLEKAIQSTDSVTKYNSNYWQALNYNNGFNVLGYLIHYEHWEAADNYLNYLIQKSGLDPMMFFKRFLDRTGFIKFAYIYNHFDIPNYNVGLSLLDFSKVEWIFNKYESAVMGIADSNERNFNLALLYKQKGVYYYKHHADQKKPFDAEQVAELFDKSLETLAMIEDDFLSESIPLMHRYYSNGFRNINRSRRSLIKYPDHYDYQWFNEKYLSTVFMEYLLDNDHFNSFFQTTEELELVNDWLANYNEYYPDLIGGSNTQRNLIPLNTEVLGASFKALKAHPRGESFDFTFLDLELANRMFQNGNVEEGLKYSSTIDKKRLQVIASRWEYLNLTYVENSILSLAKRMAENGQKSEAEQLLETMPDNNYKSIVYSSLSKFMYKTEDKKSAFIYLDSAFSKGALVDQASIPFQLDYRYYLTNVLSGIGGNDLNDIASDIFIELAPGFKDFALQEYLAGIAEEGNYFQAIQAIPSDLPESQRIFFYIYILNEEAQKMEIREGWEEVAFQLNHNFKEYIIFNDNF